MKSQLFLGLFSVVCAATLGGCSGIQGGGFDVGTLTSFYEKGKRLVGAAEGLNSEQQYYLGRGVAANILSKYRPYGSVTSPLNRYVNQVGQGLVAYSSLPYTFKGYHFLVLDSEELNAFAAPSGFIFVTKGLVKRMPDEDALAAVLAHEIAHVALGHGVSAVETSIITDVVTSSGLEAAEQYSGGVTQAILSNTKSFGLAIDDVMQTLLVRGYSRSQEYSADEYAVSLLHQAGYNPSALVSMLNQLKAAESSKGEKGGGLMNTHPAAGDRLDEVQGLDQVKGSSGDSDPGQLARAKRFQAATKVLG